MGALERRYAEALVEIAESAQDGAEVTDIYKADSAVASAVANIVNNTDIAGADRAEPLLPQRYAKIMQSLDEVTLIYKSEPGFAVLLAEPSINLNEREAIIEKLFSGKVDAGTLKFIKLLAKKRRINLLPEIREEYQRMADERSNILRIKIVTASPLDDAQLRMIREKYRKEYNAADVRVAACIDRKIGGGIKVIIGDRVDDASVMTRLENLRKALYEYQT